MSVRCKHGGSTGLSLPRWCPLLRLPSDLTLSVFHWPGPGSALPCCVVMRSITISASYSFRLKLGRKKTPLPSPLSHTSCSVLPFWVHFVLCTCHSDRDSVSVGCSVKQNGLGADWVLHLCCLSGTFKWFSTRSIFAVSDLQSPPYFQLFGRAKDLKELALHWFWIPPKRVISLLIIPILKWGGEKVVDVRVGMIISGRITEWICSLGVENKGHVEGKEG